MANRYSNLLIASGSTGKRYYANVVYPSVPVDGGDTYIITSANDRLDLIAYDFYGDPSLWWIIASANDLNGSSLFPPAGMQLRVPVDPSSAVSQFEAENKSR
jgi:hypothetical protein